MYIKRKEESGVDTVARLSDERAMFSCCWNVFQDFASYESFIRFYLLAPLFCSVSDCPTNKRLKNLTQRCNDIYNSNKKREKKEKRKEIEYPEVF